MTGLRLVPSLPPAAWVRRMPWVVRSARQFCGVCGGQPTRMALAAPGGLVLGTAGCPHCHWQLPIAAARFRTDQPRKES